MIQKDLIQRMIEQISQIIGLLMGMDLPQEKLGVIKNAYKHWLRTNPDFLLNLSPENIVKVLVEEEKYNVEQMEFLAEIMNEEGKVHSEMENYAATEDCLKKSLALFDYVNEKQQLYSFERMEKITRMKSILKELRFK